MFAVFSKKDFINAKWLVAEKLVHLLVAIYIIPKIYNALGAVDIGKLEFSKSLITTLTPLLFLGLSAICIRELVFYPQKKHQILATTLVLRLVSCLVIMGGLSTYVYFTQDSAVSVILLIIGLGYFLKITDVFEFYFQATKNAKLLFFGKMITLFILLFAQYYGVKQQYSVFYFASLIALDFFIIGTYYIAVLYFQKQLQFKQFTFSKTIAKQLLQSAYPLIISNFIIVFYISIDEFFLKHFLGDAAVGHFATVQFLVIGLTWNIGFGFILALYPALAEVYQHNKGLYAKRIKLAYLLMMGFGIVIGAFFFFVGDSIIDYFYNSEYENAKLPLKIFGWAPAFIFGGMIYEKHLVNSNLLQKNIYRFILGCVVNIVLCYILIPKYHVVGAAIAVLLSHFVTNVGWLLFDTEVLRFITVAVKTSIKKTS